MMILEQAIQEFDRHMAVERNLSDQTRRSYLSDLRQYRAFLESRGESAEGEDGIPTDPMLIRSFLASLYKEKLRKVSVSRKVAALRSFYRYLLREGKVRFNPAELLQLPRCEKYIPVVLGRARCGSTPRSFCSSPAARSTSPSSFRSMRSSRCSG